MIYNADLSDRAARLFQFLAQAQAMRSRPVRDVDDYKRSAAGGQVHWVTKAPEHAAVKSAYRDVEPSDSFLLSVDRLIRQPPPEVPPRRPLFPRCSIADARASGSTSPPSRTSKSSTS